jgi:hypothetical protein
MGQQPPPPPGGPIIPPPAPNWPGPPPPPPQPASGLLTFVAVFNLVFALFCGCTSGIWALAWSGIQQDPAQTVAWLEEHKEEFRAKVREEIEKDQSQPMNPGMKVAVEQTVDPEVMKDLVVAAARNPATPVIRTSTLVAAIAQAVLFIGSILLLMRKSAGRGLSILALLAFIGATIATMMKFPAFAVDVGEKWGSRITETSNFRELSAADQSLIQERFTDQLPEVMKGFVTAISIVALVWPVIALLILLLSRSIRDAVTRRYPAV